jgi:hypothetical protein
MGDLIRAGKEEVLLEALPSCRREREMLSQWYGVLN